VAPPAPQGPPLNQIVQTTRALHRESTARRIFFSAVNHLGRLWRADRCLAAKFNAGQPPSHVVEYCAQGINKSEPAAVARLLNTLEAQFNSTGTRVLQLPRANETAAIRQTLERLGVDSLLAHALEEGGTVGGVVVLELCTSEREWSSYDNEVLEALSDQIVLALGNARLRGLLRQFATVDDRTGLLQISSIMELLVAECAQAQDQRSSVSVLCLELLRKEGIDFRRPEVAKWLDGIGQKITAYLRPNDAAGRLKPGSFVIVLPETSSPNCGVIVERLRNVLKDFAWPDAQPLYLAAGAAEIASEPTLPTGDMKLQPEDIATDLLDRACRAVAQQRNGNEPVTILPPQPLSAIRTGSIQGEAEMAATRGR
jgi:GGDEF domain-containing protein